MPNTKIDITVNEVPWVVLKPVEYAAIIAAADLYGHLGHEVGVEHVLLSSISMFCIAWCLAMFRAPRWVLAFYLGMTILAAVVGTPF